MNENAAKKSLNMQETINSYNLPHCSAPEGRAMGLILWLMNF
jgi:hypothetical protein